MRRYGFLVAPDVAAPPQRAVGERLGIDESSMTAIADLLDGLGLMERRRDPDDRRAYEPTLADVGREASRGPNRRSGGSRRSCRRGSTARSAPRCVGC